MFKVKDSLGIRVILETDDLETAIKCLEDKEGKDYRDHLDYRQGCADNYESPADYYPTYYIVFKKHSYSIEQVGELKQVVKQYHILEDDLNDLESMKARFIKAKKSETIIGELDTEINNVKKKMEEL